MWVLIVTELLNTTVNDFDAEKSVHYSRAIVVTELVVNGSQCILHDTIPVRAKENVEIYILLPYLTEFMSKGWSLIVT